MPAVLIDFYKGIIIKGYRGSKTIDLLTPHACGGETGIRRSGYEIEKASYGIIGKESKVNPKCNRRYLQ